MTGRERLNAVLDKRPTDRLPWTTLVDNATLSLVPEQLRGNGGLDFYRHLRCDVFLLNGWNTPHVFRSPELLWADDVGVTRTNDDGRVTTDWRTPRGTLTGVTDRGHPVKYPVESLAEASIYRTMWEGASYVGHDDTDVLGALDALIGDGGLVTRFWGPSAVPMLLETDMGVENFYYMLEDHPAEIEGLIGAIHRRQREAFEHLADGPCGSVTLVENTSTFYISPDVYAKYNMPHQRDFVDIVKSRGKVALLHMCGHVDGVLDVIRETGCDGIHALTPPPTGDTRWEHALDVLGEEAIILSALAPSIFVSGEVADIGPALDAVVTPRLREANFVLGAGADGIPVEPERFRAVRDWVERTSR